MTRHFAGLAVAGVLALSATVAAQNPPAQNPPQQTPPATRTPPSQDQAAAVTVEGCLLREADVPGRKPNVAERAGIGEDYILASTKMIKGSAPAAAAAPKPGDAPTGTSGISAARMYEVSGIDDAELKKHAGHRVQIVGTFENVDRTRATPESKTPADDLVGLRGTSIRPVAGDCPVAK